MLTSEARGRPATLALLALLLSACAGSGGAAPPVTALELTAAPSPDARETVVFCAYPVERRGITECAAPVDAETQQHRESTWVLHQRGGRPVRIERVNGSGQITDDYTGAGAWDVVYEGPRVKEETAYTATGRLIERRLYSEDATRIEYRDHRGRPRIRAGGKYTAELRAWDDRGFVSTRQFFDAGGAPSVDTFGVHEVRYGRDGHGFRTELRYFDGERRPTLSNERFHRMTYEVNALGAVLVERHFDVGGAPVLTSHGTHSHTTTFDRWGNALEVRFFTADGSPAIDRRSSARWTASYDPRGNVISTAYFGVDGQPAVGSEGWASLRRSFDAHGWPIEWARFGADGLPAEKQPIVRARYDERGRVIKRSYLDASAKLRTGSYAVQRTRHDDRDNEIEVSYFDRSGKPADGGSGAVGHRTAYNDRDQPVEKSYFGPDGRTTVIRGGYAFERFTYGEGGELLHQDRFDLNGKPVALLGAKHLLVMYQGSRRAAATITRSSAEARARAEDARQKLLAGLPFEDAVRIYSDEPNASSRNGDLGKFSKGAMVAEFERALEALKVGEMSDIVETPFGFHVIVRTY